MAGRTDKNPCDIGIFLLNLCKSNNIRQADMAEKLGVARSFLSQIIYGVKTIPADWYYKLNKIYRLTNKQKAELDELMFLNKNRKCLDMTMFDEDEIDEILRYIYDGYVWIRR